MTEINSISISELCNKPIKYKWEIINKKKVFKLSHKGQELQIALVNLKDYLWLLEALEIYQGIYRELKSIKERNVIPHEEIIKMVEKKFHKK